MFGDKAVTLLKDLDRGNDFLNPYNRTLIHEILEEMRDLFHQNQQDASNGDGSEDTTTCIHVRHTAIHFNRRALLTYHFQRLQVLKRFRWEFGRELPDTVANNLSQEEKLWFNKYTANLGLYMQRLNDGKGCDLTVGQKPPKRLYVQVRCVRDHGDYELDDGTIVVLSKGSTHFLLRSQCEKLIQTAVLEQIY